MNRNASNPASKTSSFDAVIAKAITAASMLSDDASKNKLKADAVAAGAADWRWAFNAKVAGVGFLTGLPGGPLGIALEAGDLAYLMAAVGRSCYGLGYIHRGHVDYDMDLPLIFAIWAGAAEATAAVVAGKVTVKVAGKVGTVVASVVGLKIASKMLLKKVAPKAGAKIGSKILAKTGTKWIPIAGGLVSAGINYWVANSIMDSAEKYYSNDYVVLGEDLHEAVEMAVDSHRPIVDYWLNPSNGG